MSESPSHPKQSSVVHCATRLAPHPWHWGSMGQAVAVGMELIVSSGRRKFLQPPSPGGCQPTAGLGACSSVLPPLQLCGERRGCKRAKGGGDFSSEGGGKQRREVMLQESPHAGGAKHPQAGPTFSCPAPATPRAPTCAGRAVWAGCCSCAHQGRVVIATLPNSCAKGDGSP